MEIKGFDRATCRLVGEAAEAALKPIAEKFGLTLTREAGRFSDATFTVKMTFGVRDAAGQGKAASAYAGLLGLPADCVGKQFTSQGRVFTVEGIKLNRPKYPVTAVGAQGGRYKFTVAQVLAGLS